MPAKCINGRTIVTPVKPISPIDVVREKGHQIPDEVIEVFNLLIAKNYSKGESTVAQNAVLDRLWIDKEISRQDVFRNKWLDVEDVYREAGWNVAYSKPAYNETGESYFIFTVKEN